MHALPFLQAGARRRFLVPVLLFITLLGCKSAPLQQEGSGENADGTAAVTSTAKPGPKSAKSNANPLLITLKDGSTLRVPQGVRKKDTSARKFPAEIAQMQVFTWPGGERILSVTEMVEDKSKGCSKLMDEQWDRMKKNQIGNEKAASEAKFENMKVAGRRALFFAGQQQGIYGKKEGRPKVSTATLVACHSGALLVFAHANKKFEKASTARAVLVKLLSSLRPAAK